MIFKLSTHNEDGSSYLFGTAHINTKEAYTFYEDAKKILRSCQCFAAEINLSDPEIDQVKHLFQLPSGMKISSLLGHKKFEKVRKQILKSFQVDLVNFDTLRPLFIISNILNSTLSKDHPLPLDHQLHRDALEWDKEVIGLESIQDQEHIINELDLEFQLQQLKKLAEKPEKHRAKILKVNQLYAGGDIKKLYHSGRTSLGKLRQRLLYQRNEAMASELYKNINDKSVFAAVGAAHLYGERGMLKLLKDKGLSVNRVV